MQITAIFPVYTGGDLLRTSSQAEYDAAMNYFFAYHKEQFQIVVNAFASQANALRDEVNNLQNLTNTSRTLAEQEANKSLTYKNASETAYQNTVTLIENADISGTAGYTIEAVDDLMSRTRNLQFVGLN